jgi:hypothetical protein
VSRERRIRTAAQLERLRACFNEHAGGVSKAMLCHVVGVPPESVPGLMARLRKNAMEEGHTAMSLEIGGEWIYGWAETLSQHCEEHAKRRKNEARSLRLSIETYKQSETEHPEDGSLRRQRISAEHRLEDVEEQIEELSGQLRLIHAELLDDEAA